MEGSPKKKSPAKGTARKPASATSAKAAAARKDSRATKPIASKKVSTRRPQAAAKANGRGLLMKAEFSEDAVRAVVVSEAQGGEDERGQPSPGRGGERSQPSPGRGQPSPGDRTEKPKPSKPSDPIEPTATGKPAHIPGAH